MFPETRGLRTQINNYIVNRTFRTSDQFRLLVWLGLVVHASQRASFSVKRDIALSNVDIQAPLRKFFLAPRPGEEATLVFHFFQLDYKSTS
jgi:hypothetical protein